MSIENEKAPITHFLILGVLIEVLDPIKTYLVVCPPSIADVNLPIGLQYAFFVPRSEVILALDYQVCRECATSRADALD